MSPLDPSMEDLPVEVTADILSRLPVKTIIYCKCVCKKWRNILLDAYFANLHFSRSHACFIIYHNSQNDLTADTSVLKWVEVEDKLGHHRLHHGPAMSFDLNLPPTYYKSQLFPVGSVNGFLCLWKFGLETDKTYICNPITREYMTLPPPRIQYQFLIEDDAYIIYGFGVGSLTHKYKVIRIFKRDIPPSSASISASLPRLLEAEVYTLGTGQWRSFGHVPYVVRSSRAQFLNGHAHWTILDNDSPEQICAFDFDNETFDLFPSPPAEAINGSLGVLKGCLCVCDIDGSQFTIWVMKEYGIKKSWHKELVVERSIFPNLDLLTMSFMCIIEGLKDGTILMACHSHKLLAYCPRRKTIVDMEMSESYSKKLAYRPSFHRLHNFENERVHVF